MERERESALTLPSYHVEPAAVLERRSCPSAAVRSA